MLPILVQPAPAPSPLPAVLIRDLVKALAQVATGARPLSPAWHSALAEMDRMVRKRPEGDPERVFMNGLRAAAAGKPGEMAWATAAKILQQTLRTQGEGSPDAIRLWEHMADLQAAQGLPDFQWRDRVLAGRLERSRGVDEALEGATLRSLKDHWGGFLDPPRRDQTLARCWDLAGLWLRRTPKDRARVMGRTAFEEHAGALWAFAFREGDTDLRARLHECLAELPPEDLLEVLGVKSYMSWVRSTRDGALSEEVQALVLRLDPFVEARWGFLIRAALLRESGLTREYMDLLSEGLERLSMEARRELLLNELLNAPKLDAVLGRRAQELILGDPVLRDDGPTRKAWAARLTDLGLEEEASALQDGEEPAAKGKGEKGGGSAEEVVPEREMALLSSEAEAELLRAFESGNMGEVEALLWPLLESLARSETAGPFKPGELSMLPSVLVEPWLRRRAPEEAMVRLERLETLLLRAGSPLPLEITRGIPSLRGKVERQRRLIAFLGAAGEP